MATADGVRPGRSVEALLEHGAFLNALARSLVFDESRADDVVQQTWLAALEHPPPRGDRPRSWLATVARNFARRMAREESRRARREEAAAAPECVPSAEDIAAREAARRTVVEAVFALEEPYRSTVLLRYFEGMSPREIARRFGIPNETVRTRLFRALERLREHLDREQAGGRKGWCLALLPLALARPARALGTAVLSSLPEVIAVKAGTKVAIGLAGLLVVGGALYFGAPPSTGPSEPLAPPGRAPEALAGDASRATRSASPTASAVDPAERQPLAAAAEATPLDESPKAATAPARSVKAVGVVFGRVTDVRGEPVEKAEVSLTVPRRTVDAEGRESFRTDGTTDSLGFTDAEGNYRVEVLRVGRVMLWVTKEPFEQAFLFRRMPEPPFEERIDVTLRDRDVVLIRGQLLDPAGYPLPAADIRFLFPDVGHSREGDVEPVSESGIWALASLRVSVGDRARIDPDLATFEIGTEPGRGRLVVALFRREPIAEKTWEEGDPDVEFRLDVPAIRARLGSLEVRVLDAATRAPIPAASVSVEEKRGTYRFRSHETLPTDRAAVRFEDLPAGVYEVFAYAMGYGQAGVRVEIAPGARTEAELRLGEPAQVRLRLVPLEGWTPNPGDHRVEYFDAEGLSFCCDAEWETLEGERFVRLKRPPSGAGYAVIAGNVLRLELASGENPDRDFPIRRPRLLRVRYRPAKSAFGPGGALVFDFRLLFEGRVPILATTPHTSARDGWCEHTCEAPPGRYAIEIDPGRGKALRKDVVIGERETTEVVIESP